MLLFFAPFNFVSPLENADSGPTSRVENVELVARITTVRSMPRNSNFILIMAHEETKGTEEEEEEEKEKENDSLETRQTASLANPNAPTCSQE